MHTRLPTQPWHTRTGVEKGESKRTIGRGGFTRFDGQQQLDLRQFFSVDSLTKTTHKADTKPVREPLATNTNRSVTTGAGSGSARNLVKRRKRITTSDAESETGKEEGEGGSPRLSGATPAPEQAGAAQSRGWSGSPSRGRGPRGQSDRGRMRGRETLTLTRGGRGELPDEKRQSQQMDGQDRLVPIREALVGLLTTGASDAATDWFVHLSAHAPPLCGRLQMDGEVPYGEYAALLSLMCRVLDPERFRKCLNAHIHLFNRENMSVIRQVHWSEVAADWCAQQVETRLRDKNEGGIVIVMGAGPGGHRLPAGTGLEVRLYDQHQWVGEGGRDVTQVDNNRENLRGTDAGSARYVLAADVYGQPEAMGIVVQRDLGMLAVGGRLVYAVADGGPHMDALQAAIREIGNLSHDVVKIEEQGPVKWKRGKTVQMVVATRGSGELGTERGRAAVGQIGEQPRVVADHAVGTVHRLPELTGPAPGVRDTDAAGAHRDAAV